MFPFAKRTKKSVGAISVHTTPPKSMALIYNSGKMTVCGTTSILAAALACENYLEMLRECTGNRNIRIVGFQIANVTSTTTLGFVLDVHRYNRDFVTPRLPTSFAGALIPSSSSSSSHSIVHFMETVNVVGAKNDRDFGFCLEKEFETFEKYGVPENSEEAQEIKSKAKKDRKKTLDKNEEKRLQSLKNALKS